MKTKELSINVFDIRSKPHTVTNSMGDLPHERIKNQDHFFHSTIFIKEEK